jgi:hypothetical protein
MKNDVLVLLPLIILLLGLFALVLVGRGKPLAKDRSIAEIRNIGKYQRLTMWALLAGFTNLIPGFNVLLFLPVAIFQILMVYRLTKALESPLAVLRCFLCFIPLVSLGNLYLITNQATIILKDSGIKVGVMGASQSDLDALT